MGLYVTRRGRVGFGFGLFGSLFALVPLFFYLFIKGVVVLTIAVIRLTAWSFVFGAALFGANRSRRTANHRSRRAQLPSAAPQPGWYQYPADPIGTIRYWDGRIWTGWFK